MKKTIVTLLILFTISSFAVFAQTEQEVDAEAERVVGEYVDRNFAAASEDLKKSNPKKMYDLLLVDPYNSTILFELGQWYVRVDGSISDLSAAVFLRYLELVPDDAAGYYNFAVALSNSGYVAESDKYYAKSLELASKPSWENHYWRGAAAFQNLDYRQCIESMTKALELTPEKGDQRWTYGYLSWCQSLSGDKTSAAANMQKAISIGGDEVGKNFEVASGAYTSSPPKCEEEHKMLEKYNKREYKTWEKQYAAFFQVFSCHPKSRTVNSAGIKLVFRNIPAVNYWLPVYGRRDSLRYLPADQVDAANYENSYKNNTLQFLRNSLLKRSFNEFAVTQLREYNLLTPKSDVHHYLRSRYFLELSDVKMQAWREANRYLALYPNHPFPRLIRARVYQEIFKNPEKALAEINIGLKNNSRIAELYFTRGKIYYESKEYAKAVSDFEAVLQIDPDHPDALFYKNLAVNPQSSADSAISARTKENELGVRLNDIIKLVNASMIEFETRAKLAKNKTEQCAALARQTEQYAKQRSNLSQLGKEINPNMEVWKRFKSTSDDLERNIKNAQEVKLEKCLN